MADVTNIALYKIAGWLNEYRTDTQATLSEEQISAILGLPLRNKDNGDDFIITPHGVFVCVDQQLKAIYTVAPLPALAETKTNVYEVRALINAIHGRLAQLVAG